MKTHNNINFGRYEALAYNEGYRIDNDGLLLNPKGDPIGSFHRSGYHRFGLRIKNKKCVVHTHRLQAYQKYGDAIYVKGIMVRHLDGDKTNNSIDNIAIGNCRDNQMDRPEECRMNSAIKAAKSVIKYNSEEVIKFHSNNGKSYKKTMSEFNIPSKGSLHYVLNSRKIVNAESTTTP